MKQKVILGLVVSLMLVFFCVICAHGDGPSQTSFPQRGIQKSHPPQKGAPQPFYGYVPPPPIRHTWPGGYKALFLELGNTLSEHILGKY
jgi:hypothetical protein